MNLTVAILTAVAALAMLYFLSAGVSFAIMYLVGKRFPFNAASALYAPLEALSQRSRLFCRIYNGLCVLSYRIIVRGPLYGGWPPPPPNL